MYQAILACKGVPVELGLEGAVDVVKEFRHRPWHQNVHCDWDGKELILCAENDWDADAKALLDEFSDAISACIPGTFGYEVEVRSVTAIPRQNRSTLRFSVIVG
jgi:hypothetical protein